MSNYASEADIEATVGFDIDSDSIPNSTQLTTILGFCDDIINTEMKVSSNITDTYGYLKVVECALVYKWIMNILSMKKPDEYGPVDVELTPAQMRLIHMAYDKWTSLTFEVL